MTAERGVRGCLRSGLFWLVLVGGIVFVLIAGELSRWLSAPAGALWAVALTWVVTRAADKDDEYRERPGRRRGRGDP